MSLRTLDVKGAGALIRRSLPKEVVWSRRRKCQIGYRGISLITLAIKDGPAVSQEEQIPFPFSLSQLDLQVQKKRGRERNWSFWLPPRCIN